MADAPRSPGRPPDPALRGRIIDAAWKLFLQDGVKSTSVRAIADAAGISKVTLYKHFTDKTALLVAGVQVEQDKLKALRQRAPGASLPLEQTLITFGEATMTYLTTGDAVDFYTVLAGDLRREPDLARAFYEAGPGSTHAALTAVIEQAAAAGQLTVDDPSDAAERLFGMWQGFSNFQLALSPDSESIRASLPARVREAVRIFLFAYADSKDTA